jgi:hypothetical protein
MLVEAGDYLVLGVASGEEDLVELGLGESACVFEAIESFADFHEDLAGFTRADDILVEVVLGEEVVGEMRITDPHVFVLVGRQISTEVEISNVHGSELGTGGDNGIEERLDDRGLCGICGCITVGEQEIAGNRTTSSVFESRKVGRAYVELILLLEDRIVVRRTLAFCAHLGFMGTNCGLGIHKFTHLSDARVDPQGRFRTFKSLRASERGAIGIDIQDPLGEDIGADTVAADDFGQDLGIPVVLFFVIEGQTVADLEKNAVYFILGLEGLLEESGVDIFEDGFDCEGKGLTTEMERGRADVWSGMAG